MDKRFHTYSSKELLDELIVRGVMWRYASNQIVPRRILEAYPDREAVTERARAGAIHSLTTGMVAEGVIAVYEETKPVEDTLEPLALKVTAEVLTVKPDADLEWRPQDSLYGY